MIDQRRHQVNRVLLRLAELDLRAVAERVLVETHIISLLLDGDRHRLREGHALAERIDDKAEYLRFGIHDHMGKAVEIGDDLVRLLVALPLVHLLDIGEHAEELLVSVVLEQTELHLRLIGHHGLPVLCACRRNLRHSGGKDELCLEHLIDHRVDVLLAVLRLHLFNRFFQRGIGDFFRGHLAALYF